MKVAFTVNGRWHSVEGSLAACDEELASHVRRGANVVVTNIVPDSPAAVSNAYRQTAMEEVTMNWGPEEDVRHAGGGRGRAAHVD